MSLEVENLDKAKLKHRSGKIEEAIKIYQKLIVKEEKNPDVFFLLGTAFLQKKITKGQLIVKASYKFE